MCQGNFTLYFDSFFTFVWHCCILLLDLNPGYNALHI